MVIGMRKDSKIICSDYLDFIRSQPCLVCMMTVTDPDHIMARGRGEAKRMDFCCVPLCRKHHSERGQIGDAEFETKYDINLWKEALFLVTEFFVGRVSHRDFKIEKGKI